MHNRSERSPLLKKRILFEDSLWGFALRVLFEHSAACKFSGSNRRFSRFVLWPCRAKEADHSRTVKCPVRLSPKSLPTLQRTSVGAKGESKQSLLIILLCMLCIFWNVPTVAYSIVWILLNVPTECAYWMCLLNTVTVLQSGAHHVWCILCILLNSHTLRWIFLSAFSSECPYDSHFVEFPYSLGYRRILSSERTSCVSV